LYHNIVLLRLNSFVQRYFIIRLIAHQFDIHAFER